ncbi:MAG: glycosyltransferase family 4 protein [Nitrososphaera sp.]|uniref:glycosyltransferase family 4 protein n=1 Tax=Nitrososphaera sp. TaxID=1971748 RepID=UPI003D6ECD30
MNILYLTEFLSAIGGGGEVAFYNYAQAMAERGHNVHVICRQSPEDFGVRTGSLHVHRIGPETSLRHGHFPTLAQQAAYVPGAVAEGCRIIRRQDIDVIHANTLSPAIAGTALSMISGLPLVNTFHHVYAVKSKRYLQGMALLRLPRLACEKAILGLPADVVHAVSQSTRDDLVQFGVKPERITVVPNAVPQLWASGRRSYQGYALFMGRLVKSKNLDVVIRAFRRVVDAVPAARLIVAGDGPARAEWAEMASLLGLEDNIRFEGYVSEKRKEELLANCSAVVFPSLIEGFGLIALEAFAHEKPVLASDTDSSRERVRHGIDGLLLPAHDAIKWAEAMTGLFADRAACAAMGGRGKARAERFKIDDVARELEALYFRAARARGGHPDLAVKTE